MNTDFHISALGLVGLIFVIATGTWMFWNGLFGIIRFAITGVFP